MTFQPLRPAPRGPRPAYRPAARPSPEGTYAIMECYSGSGRPTGAVLFSGTPEACDAYIDERIDILPFATGDYAVGPEQDVWDSFERGEHVVIGHEPRPSCLLCRDDD